MSFLVPGFYVSLFLKPSCIVSQWPFVSLVAEALSTVSRGCSSLQRPGFSLRQLLLLRSLRSVAAPLRRVGPSQTGSDPCPLRWQVDTHPLYHQGHPLVLGFQNTFRKVCPLPSYKETHTWLLALASLFTLALGPTCDLSRLVCCLGLVWSSSGC